MVEAPKGLLRSFCYMTETQNKSTPRGAYVQQGSSTSASGPDAWTAPFSAPNMLRVSWTDALNGSKNARWRYQVRNGFSATTTMNASRKTVMSSPGRFAINYGIPQINPNPSGRRRTMVTGCPGIDSSFFNVNTIGVSNSSAVSNAASLWYQAARDKMSRFKGMTFLAEAPEAKRMMFDRASKMITAIPTFQNRLRKRWVRSRTKRGKLKTLSDSWLELQFGWLPLASDIEDAYETIQSPGMQDAFVVAEANSESLESFDSSQSLSPTMCLSITDKTFAVGSCKYYGVIRCRGEPSGSKLLDFGLGVREFLPTLWEVIPWSFAIDYFTNVNEIVNAASYATVEKRWLSRVDRFRRSRERHVHSPVFNYATSPGSLFVEVTDAVPSSVKVEAEQVFRYPAQSVPIPSFHWEIPSPKQFLNLAALAVSRRLRLAY
jgi:hypothetical protein